MFDYCYHIHTPRCGHADPEMHDADIAKMFYEAGFKDIAFTDHCPWKTFTKEYKNHSMSWDLKQDYLDSTRALKKEYEGKMNIHVGFECEYVPEYRSEMEELKRDSEIIVVGQHFIRQKDGNYKRLHDAGFIPNDYEMDSYANALEEACAEGFPDILAHPDLYMLRKEEFGKKEEELAHKICQTAERYNVPVEINLCRTSMNLFFRECTTTYPCRGFWNIAKDYKLRTVIGLDFHGHFHPEKAEESFKATTKLIGEDVVSQLNILSSAPDLKYSK